MELYGVEYVLDYALMLHKDESYRIYITDALRMIAEGKHYPSYRYADIIEPKKAEPELSPDDIIEQVNRKAGLNMIEEGSEE